MLLATADATEIDQMAEGDVRRLAHRLVAENAALQAEKLEMAAKLAWFQRQAFGTKSERSKKGKAGGKGAAADEAQITGSLLATPVHNDLTDDEAEAPLNDGPAAGGGTAGATSSPQHQPGSAHAQGKNRTHSGRRPVPPHLQRVEQKIPVPEADRRLPDGTPMVFLGYEESSRLHLITEQVVQLLMLRERWGIRENGVATTLVTAAMPPALSVRGKFTDTLIIKLLLDKFSLGVPFNRQGQELNARGAEVTRSTVCDQLQTAVAPLEPIAAAVRDQILAEPFIHADETPHKYQVRNDSGRCTGTKTGYFIELLAGKQAFFEFAVSRAQCHILRVLGFETDALTDPLDDGLPDRNGKPTKPCIGFLMADAYGGYNRACGPGKYARQACFAHGRRKFELYEELDANAAAIMVTINDLYRIEREAKRESARLSLDRAGTEAVYLAARQAQSVPLLDKLKTQLTALTLTYTPREGMGKAIAYFLKRWEDFTRYTQSGALPIDNNAAERSIRGLVVGRKNWYFAGSEDAAGWAAVMHTLIESCRLQGIDPRQYLTHVVEQLHREPATAPATLTPRSLAPMLKRP